MISLLIQGYISAGGKGFEPHFNIKKVFVSPVDAICVLGKGFELLITGTIHASDVF